MNRYITFLLLFVSLFSFSCSRKKKKAAVYYASDETVDYSTNYTRDIVVPFTERDGVKYVPIKVNGVAFEMIFDTGCSIGTTLSMAEAKYLFNKDKLSKADILGSVKSKVADGRIVNDAVVNLKEVVIDDKISIYNVKATVSEGASAPLLLGNDILDKAATITIDNQNKTLNFKLKK